MTGDFWEKLDRTGGPDSCWTLGKPFPKKYPTVKVKGITVGAHRYAWEAARGPIPDGLWVCHSCDNKACCNPAHLYLGTPTMNMRDALHHGLLRTYLTEQDVVAIRREFAGGQRNRDIARRYGIHRNTVYKIVTFRIWRQISDVNETRQAMLKSASAKFSEAAQIPLL